MKKDYLDFKSDKLFPWHFQLFGVAFLIGGVAALIGSPYVAPFLILIGLLILTAHRGIEFDLSKSSYRVYNSFLFIKSGKSIKYRQMEKLYINSGSVSQKIYTRVNLSTTYKNVEYDAYLKMDNENKIFLSSHKNKEGLIGKLTVLAEFFSLEIIDNTV